MNKSIINKALIIGAVLIALLFVTGKLPTLQSLMSTFEYKDMAIYDDFEDGIIDTAKMTLTPASPESRITCYLGAYPWKEAGGRLGFTTNPWGTSVLECGGLFTGTSSECGHSSCPRFGSGTVDFTKDFRGYDLEMVATISKYQPEGCMVCNSALSQTLGSCTWTEALPLIKGGSNKALFIEYTSSRLNTSRVQIKINGVERCVADLGTNPLKLTYSFSGGLPGTFIIDYLHFRIPFSCVIEPGEMLASETFVAGDTIDIFSTRYPVSKFCLQHPAIITSTADGGSTATAEIYQQLVTGSTLTVPEGQTYTLFYVFDNSANLVPTTCNVEDALNVDTNECGASIGIVNVCSAGIFDSATGTCVVESTTVCDQGTLEQLGDGSLACVYRPPVMQACTEGTLNITSGQCELYLQPTIVNGTIVVQAPPCPDGYQRTVLANNNVLCTAPLVIDGDANPDAASDEFIDDTAGQDLTDTGGVDLGNPITGTVEVSENAIKCEGTKGSELTCIDGTKITEKDCVDKTVQYEETKVTCIYDPTAGLVGGSLFKLKLLTDNILWVLLITTIMVVILAYVNTKRFQWSNVKSFTKFNKEGMLLGFVIGIGLAYLVGFRIEWTTLWMGLSGMNIGIILDHLYRPRR